MFEIEYKGANSVKIATKKTTVVFDPKLSLVGLKDVSSKGVVQVATESRFATGSVAESKVLIEGPGEYEVGDISIKGIAAQCHIDTEEAEKLSTIYRLEANDIRVAVLGNIAPSLTDDQLEKLGVIDILVIPVGGGGYTLDATSAVALVHRIEPRVVVPVHYADSGVSYEVPQDVAETFIKELGAEAEDMSKYKLKSASSLPESLTVVRLSRTA